MPITFDLILIATVGLYLITPLYTSIRGRIQRNIVDQDQPIKFYTRRRILRIVSVNMLMMLFVLALIVLLTNAIKTSSGAKSWQADEIQVLWLIFITSSVICYGSGAYIASIVSEEYTLNKLEKTTEFKVLNLPIKLFHGPISHVLMYSGGLILLWLFAELEKVTVAIPFNPTISLPYFLCGLAFGVMYAIAQIRNLTWKDQLPWMSAITVAFVLLTANSSVDVYSKPLLMFNLGNSFSLMLVLLLRLFHFKITHGKYTYDFKKLLDPTI